MDMLLRETSPSGLIKEVRGLRSSSWVGLIVRFIVSALVLMLVSFLLPGFALLSFGQALIAAVVIAVLGFVVESLFGKKVSPQNRGIVGFLTAAVVLASLPATGASLT